MSPENPDNRAITLGSSSAMQPVRRHLPADDEAQGGVGGMKQELNPFSTLCKTTMAPMQEPKTRSYKIL